MNWPIVTCIVVIINLISWCVVSALYNLPLLEPHSSYLLLRVGALNGDLLWAGGGWRIITSQFLHVHFAHLVFNMVALVLLGVGLERSLGPLRFLLLYLIGGSVGQVAGAIATPELISSGASQAVLAVAGARAVQLLRRPERSQISVIVLVAVVGIQLGLDMLVARTVKVGHWSSLCAGAIMGYVSVAYQRR
jgi:rhomboid protease GluP